MICIYKNGDVKPYYTIYKNASASGGLNPTDPLPGLCPCTPLPPRPPDLFCIDCSIFPKFTPMYRYGVISNKVQYMMKAYRNS